MVQRVKGQTRSGVVDRRTVFRAGSGVRELLLADWRKRFGPSSRWFRPGHVSDYERRLAAGEPLLVDSATLWSALFRAGLPNDEYGRDGVFHGMYWHISEAGEVTEWTVEDSTEYGIDDPRIEREPGKHCKGGGRVPRSGVSPYGVSPEALCGFNMP